MRPLIPGLFGLVALWRRAAFCAAVILPAALLGGCAPDTPSKPGPSGVDDSDLGGSGGGTGTATGTDDTGPCEDGATRACKVDLGTHHGVTSCFEGVQTCAEGVWGACEEAADVSPPPPPGSGLGPVAGQTLDKGFAAQPCLFNSCDPTCMCFTEAPVGGVTPPEDATPFDWATGSTDSLSSELHALGTREPCADSADCQFDQYCQSPMSGSCAHSKCVASPGVALVADCDPCVQAICAAEPGCCGAAGWTEACVARVPSVCGAVCPPPGCDNDCPPEGRCAQWLAGRAQDDCAGPDLTAGIACSAAAVPVLPVCNRGGAAAPAGVRIALFPTGSSLIPTPKPDLATAVLCATTEPIPPGECVDVPLCAVPTPGAEIMVNPPGLPDTVAECHANNDWTVWPKALAACAAPACAGGTAKAGLKKVNLFFAIDRSMSMLLKSTGLPGQPTRWKQTTDAIKGFAMDTRSAGLGVWMRLWPYNKDASCPAVYPMGCQSAGCAVPNVPLATLSAASAPADAQEAAVIAALDLGTPDYGNTPLYPSLKGVLSAAQAHQTTHPDEATVVVLVTDGEPTYCDTSAGHIAGLAADALAASGVRTFVIGIADVSEATISMIAAAGDGQYFLVGSGAAVPVAQQVEAALSAIRTTLVACTFPLPDASTFDVASMTVTLLEESAGAHPLQEVAGSGDCAAGGWYYDDPESLSKLRLCPSTCASLRADPDNAVQIHASCPGAYAPLGFEQVYSASCPKAMRPVWGYLAYDAVTPSDSSVELWAASSEEAEIDDATETLVALARTSDGTSLCAMGGPAPCPIDLSVALGGAPADGLPFLRLRASLSPSSNAAAAPTLSEWKITYSCVDAE